MSVEHETPSALQESLVKIVIALEESGMHSYAFETLWAEDIGDRKYALMNSPFYAYGYSFEDIVIAEIQDGQLVVQEVSEHSGHSTYRIFLSEETTPEKFQEYWKPIGTLGCTYEHARGSLYAIDVPLEADIHGVYELLEKGERDNIWGFEEGYCGHKVKK